jgi:adenine-specific DNA-methyltransferase
LSYWSGASLKPLQLSPRELLPSPVNFSVSTLDAFDVRCQPQDVAYIDPPYTKRQYAAYYHLLETIAVGDEPIVEGVTGLRPWEEKASPFCYKVQALEALLDWVRRCRAARIFLSYSSEGHVELNALQPALNQLVGAEGCVRVHALAEIDRYRPNVAAHQGAAQVTEYLIQIDRPALLDSFKTEAAPRAKSHSMRYVPVEAVAS